MSRTKKAISIATNNEIIGSVEILEETETPTVEDKYVRVMDKETRNVITVDTSAEKDWMTKYLHRSGVEFN